MIRSIARTLGLAAYFASTAAVAAPMTTSFTYQGQLKHAGAPVNGRVDFEFRLWTAPTGGLSVGYEPETLELVDGLFTTQIDFGSSEFRGDARWLAVRVEYPPGTWTNLSPRQPITAAPYALLAKRSEDLELPFAAMVDTADNAVSVTQTGPGKVASFNLANGGTDEAAVYASQGGVGPCGQFAVNNVANSEAAVLATSIGTGPGVHGKSLSSGAAVRGSALGTGRAAYFHTDYATNDNPTVYAEQKGVGRCGHFRITNANNDLGAVSASTTGDGAAVSGYTVGEGSAGSFAINNASSDAPAIVAKTNGGGYAVSAESTSDAEPSGGGGVVVGLTSGINVAVDGNEIMARNNGETSTLYLNADGGDVVIGGTVDIGYEVVSDTEEDTDELSVYCSAGKKVIGGGCYSNTAGNYIEESRPVGGGTGWRCRCRYSIVFISAYAICADVQ